MDGSLMDRLVNNVIIYAHFVQILHLTVANVKQESILKMVIIV